MKFENSPGPRAWQTVALLWVVGCLNYLDRVTITTMRESLQSEIPMTESQFGLLTTVFLVVYGTISPFAGFVADRFSRAHVITVSLFVWSLVTWLTAHVSTYPELLATRALMGISEACYIPAALALIADYHPGRTRSLATGVNITGIMAGSGLGGLGGWLAERHGWEFPFTIFGAVGVAYSVLLILFLRNQSPTETNSSEGLSEGNEVRLWAAFRSLFRQQAFLLALLFWGLLGLAGWAVLGWMPTYFREHFHLSQGQAGLSATGFLQAGALVGVLLGGYWADRWSQTQAHARILVPAIGLCVAAPCIWLVTSVDIFPLAVTGLALYGLFAAFADANMMPILCMVADRRFRATGYGLLNFFATAIGGLTVYLGGALRDLQIDVRYTFQLGSICLLGCAGILFYLRTRTRRLGGR